MQGYTLWNNYLHIKVKSIQNNIKFHENISIVSSINYTHIFDTL